jgi:hypothetical protein
MSKSLRSVVAVFAWVTLVTPALVVVPLLVFSFVSPGRYTGDWSDKAWYEVCVVRGSVSCLILEGDDPAMFRRMVNIMDASRASFYQLTGSPPTLYIALGYPGSPSRSHDFRLNLKWPAIISVILPLVVVCYRSRRRRRLDRLKGIPDRPKSSALLWVLIAGPGLATVVLWVFGFASPTRYTGYWGDEVWYEICLDYGGVSYLILESGQPEMLQSFVNAIARVRTMTFASNGFVPLAGPGTAGIAPILRIYEFRLPLFFPMLAFIFLPGLMLFYRAQKRRHLDSRNLCRVCGYDLYGNESGRCPECGTDIGKRREAGSVQSPDISDGRSDGVL